MSTSLDGFVAGPNDSPEYPLGDGGERLHEWIYDLASWREARGLKDGETDGDDAILKDSIENVGAVVMGRRMFDSDDGPWRDDPSKAIGVRTPPSACRNSSSRTTPGSRS